MVLHWNVIVLVPSAFNTELEATGCMLLFMQWISAPCLMER